MLKIELDKEFHIYGDGNFINYAKLNFEDLMSGDGKTHVSKLFNTKVKNGKKLRRIPFFIYWLYSKINHSWTMGNFPDSIKGRANINKDSIGKVELVIDKINEDPNLRSYFKGSYAYHDTRRIIYRYQVKYNRIVERKILETFKTLPLLSQTIPKNCPSFGIGDALRNNIKPSLTEIFKQYDEVLNYIKSQGTVIQSEMRRNKRNIQRIEKNQLEWILNSLEEEGIIAIKIYSGRTFLIFRRKRNEKDNFSKKI